MLPCSYRILDTMPVYCTKQQTHGINTHTKEMSDCRCETILVAVHPLLHESVIMYYYYVSLACTSVENLHY